MTREERVVNTINKRLADSINKLSDIYHCEQEGKDLIVKGEYYSYDYIFKFKNFTNLLKVNDNLVVDLFTSKKDDIIYRLNQHNGLLASSKEIIDICSEELERSYIDKVLLSFENKYKYDFCYNHGSTIFVNIKKTNDNLLYYYKRNNEWFVNIGNYLLDCEIEEILEIKEISKELLNKLNNRK